MNPGKDCKWRKLQNEKPTLITKIKNSWQTEFFRGRRGTPCIMCLPEGAGSKSEKTSGHTVLGVAARAFQAIIAHRGALIKSARPAVQPQMIYSEVPILPQRACKPDGGDQAGIGIAPGLIDVHMPRALPIAAHTAKAATSAATTVEPTGVPARMEMTMPSRAQATLMTAAEMVTERKER